MSKHSASADTAKMGMVYAIEDEWGIAPNKKYQTLRPKGQSLGINKTTTESAEIRADRNITDVVDTGLEAQGNIDFELSFGAYDEFLAAGLFSDWSESLDIRSNNGDIRIVASQNQIVHEPPTPPEGEKAALTSKFDGIKAGQWIRLSGFKAENNGFTVCRRA